MRLVFSQDLTVYNAMAMKTSVLDALELDLTGVRTTDLAGRQLFCASTQKTRAQGVRLTASGAESLEHETAHLAGFGYDFESAGCCPWRCGGT